MTENKVVKLWQGVCNGERVTSQAPYDEVAEAVFIYQLIFDTPVEIVYIGTRGKERG